MQINDLQIYIPFIDYLISLDKDKYLKFLQIKQWILVDKTFSADFLQKLEQSIFVQYRNLFLTDTKIPKYVIDIFKKKGNTKTDTINLCTDDESDNEETSRDKDSTIPTHKIGLKKFEETNGQNFSNQEIRDLSSDDDHVDVGRHGRRRICNLSKEILDARNNGKVENKVCQEKSKNHNAIKLLEPVIISDTSSDDDEHPLENRIPCASISDNDELNKLSKNEFPNFTYTKKSLEERDKTSKNILKADSVPINLPGKKPYYENGRKEITSNSESTNDILENLDLETLTDIFENLVKYNNLDINLILKELNSTENGSLNSHSSSPEPSSDYTRRNSNLTNDRSSNLSTPNTPIICENINSTHATIFDPVQMGIPQISPLQTVHQNSHLPTAGASTYPILNFNGRKINLNDPRVRQHLKTIQDSPVLRLSSQIPSQTTKDQEEQRVVRPPRNPGQATTYREYKRLKAQTMKEDKGRKIMESKSKTDKLNEAKREEGVSAPKQTVRSNEENQDSAQEVERERSKSKKKIEMIKLETAAVEAHREEEVSAPKQTVRSNEENQDSAQEVEREKSKSKKKIEMKKLEPPKVNVRECSVLETAAVEAHREEEVSAPKQTVRSNEENQDSAQEVEQEKSKSKKKIEMKKLEPPKVNVRECSVLETAAVEAHREEEVSAPKQTVRSNEENQDSAQEVEREKSTSKKKIEMNKLEPPKVNVRECSVLETAAVEAQREKEVSAPKQTVRSNKEEENQDFAQEVEREKSKSKKKIEMKKLEPPKVNEKQRSVLQTASVEKNIPNLQQCAEEIVEKKKTPQETHLKKKRKLTECDQYTSESDENSSNVALNKTIDETSNSNVKRHKKQKPASFTERILKELKCTVIGFNKFEDYFSPSSTGKRKSSETARSAIAKQLSRQASIININEKILNSEDKTKTPPPARRSSFNPSRDNNTSCPSMPVQKRRKTCTEVDIEKLLLNSHSDTGSKIHVTQTLNSIDTSSSDTDIFDFTDFHYKKAKALALKNQPFVLLERLTESEIEKHLAKKSVKSQELCFDVQLVPGSVREDPKHIKAAATRQKNKVLPNTNAQMTERKSAFCALCKAKPANLVNHYVRVHNTEPYVSRLTTKEFEDLQINCPFATYCSGSGPLTKYKVQCVFCGDELLDHFINFYAHYSTHTGEYAFQCSKCEIKKPFRADIQSHKHHVKACRNARIQKLYVYPSNLMVIYLYCCKLCNFVQLNEANTYKHLRDHHSKISDDAVNIQRYIAAAINDAEIVNEPAEDDRLLLQEEPQNKDNEEYILSDIISEEIIVKQEILPKDYPSPSRPDIPNKVPISHMTSIPLSNLNSMSVTSFLDQNIEAEGNSQCENSAEIEIPRPIILKEEIKLEELADCRSYQSSSTELSQGKSAISQYRAYPRDVSYFGLFKCMAANCFFSTDIDSEMLSHLNDHTVSSYPSYGYLDCSYCQWQTDELVSPIELVAHIQRKHSHSRFQCPKCSYRSCVSGNVSIHLSIFHVVEPDEEFVYECVGNCQSVNEKLQDIIKCMERHVRKLECTYCPLSFAATNLLRTHLEEIHGIMGVCSLPISEYACIYCVKDSTDKSEIQKHLTINHPDELALACRRVLRDTEMEDSISNLILWDITESAANIKKPITSSTNLDSEPPEIIPDDLQNTPNMSSNSEPVNQKYDLKPSAAQLESISEESLCVVLDKLTFKTGVPPDQLYHCPIATCGGFFSTYMLWSRHMSSRHNCLLTRCPHCPKHEDLSLADFQQHFEQHRRHMYVCFHCSKTFVNEHATTAHFRDDHSNESNFHFETVKFNLIYSYRIIIGANTCTGRLDFLQTMRENVIKRLEELANDERAKLLCQWLIPKRAQWLENYSLPNRQSRKNCVIKTCNYISRSDDQFFQHLDASHKISPATEFKCNRCPVVIRNMCSWQPIAEHVKLHNVIYVCCVCDFRHFGRRELSTHIQLEHNYRDVPYLTLYRAEEDTFISFSVSFVAGRRTFSTTNTCFFCNASKLSMETFCKHLKRAHNVFLQYHCDHCLTALQQLSDVNAHHVSAHADGQLKISCEFLSHNHLLLRTISPLSIDILQPETAAAIKDSSSAALNMVEWQEEGRHLQVEDCNYFGSLNQVRVKREILDDGEDSSVEILEEDDVVCNEEHKAHTNEVEKSTKDSRNIRCINVKNLLRNQSEVSTPSIPEQPDPSVPQPSSQQMTQNNLLLRTYLKKRPKEIIEAKTVEVPTMSSMSIPSTGLVQKSTTALAVLPVQKEGLQPLNTSFLPVQILPNAMIYKAPIFPNNHDTVHLQQTQSAINNQQQSLQTPMQAIAPVQSVQQQTTTPMQLQKSQVQFQQRATQQKPQTTQVLHQQGKVLQVHSQSHLPRNHGMQQTTANYKSLQQTQSGMNNQQQRLQVPMQAVEPVQQQTTLPIQQLEKSQVQFQQRATHIQQTPQATQELHQQHQVPQVRYQLQTPQVNSFQRIPEVHNFHSQHQQQTLGNSMPILNNAVYGQEKQAVNNQQQQTALSVITKQQQQQIVSPTTEGQAQFLPATVMYRLPASICVRYNTANPCGGNNMNSHT